MADPRPLLDRGWVRAALLAVVLALGAAVRLAPWTWVFGGPEVRLVGDGDPLYHLLQAERLERGGLAATWHDPGLDYPLGADVPWPPLFDGLLATAGRLAAGGAAPDRATLEQAAACVPVLLGLLALLLVAALGRVLLGGRPWLDAALLLALLPSHAMLTSLGRPDQHALEPLLLGLMVLAAARLAAPGSDRRRPAALLAIAVALAFWNWNGSALYLALLAGFAAAWHLAGGRGEQAPGRTAAWLAGSLGAGALLLAASVALLGPTTAILEARLSGVSGLQPALVAGAALACAALSAARRFRPGAGWVERLVTLAAALLLPVGLLLALPWSAAPLGRGLTMLGARGWYRTIVEFQPILFGGINRLSADWRTLQLVHGAALLAVPAALPLAWRRWRATPAEARGPLLLFLVFTASALLLGFARNRFVVYLALAEALGGALVARELALRVAARWPSRRWDGPAAAGALLLLLLAPALPGLLSHDWAVCPPARYADLAPLARLAGRLPAPPGREAVLAPWSHGHDVRYHSGRPVISSPFGIEGGEGALETDAALHYTSSAAEAEALLARRRVAFLLLTEPLDELGSLAAFAPALTRPVIRIVSGPVDGLTVTVLEAFRTLVVARLYLWDGQWGALDGRPLPEGPAALDGFRLVGESGSPAIWHAVATPLFKLFEPVAGARLRVTGAAPGTMVEGRVTVRTNVGRVFTFTLRDRAGEDGVARLRLPYAAGVNGAVAATPWQLASGASSATVSPSDADVLLGAAVEARLAAPR